MAQINKNTVATTFTECVRVGVGVGGSTALSTLRVSSHLPSNNSMKQVLLLLHFTEEDIEIPSDPPWVIRPSWTAQPTLPASVTRCLISDITGENEKASPSGNRFMLPGAWTKSV